MKKIRRKASIIFKKIGKYFIPLVSFILTVSRYVLSFLNDDPDALLLGRFKLSNYDIANFTWWLISSVFIIVIIFWLWSRNAPPLVSIDVHSWKSDAYLRVENDEPSDLNFIDIKVGALKLGNNMGNSLEHLGLENIIKIEKRIINGEKVSIIVASGNRGYTKFTMDGGLHNLALNGRDNEKSQGKYKIAFEVWVHPRGEDKSLFAGMYIGTIHHTCFNGFKTEDGITYGDTVFWENNAIKKVNKKVYDAFVHPEKSVNPKLISQL